MTTPNLGGVPDWALNHKGTDNEGNPFGGLAAFAAKSEEDWRNELQLPFDTSAGDIRDGLWGDMPLDVGSFILTLLTELAKRLLPFDLIADWPVVSDVLDALDSWTGSFNDILAILINVGGELLGRIFNFLSLIFSTIGEDVLEPLFDFLGWIWGVFGEAVESILKPVSLFLDWIFDQFGSVFVDVIEDLLKPLITLFANIFDHLVHGRFIDIIVGIIDFIVGLFEGLPTPAEILDSLRQGLRTVLNLITGGVFDDADFTIPNIIEAIRTFISRIPLVGPLLLAITNGNQAITDLAGLASWFQQNVLKIDSAIPAKNLFGSIPATVLSLLPVAHIDDSTPNLLSESGFKDATVMQEGGRWAFDPAVNCFGSGGSAKVTCNSSYTALYSSPVAVSKDNRLELSAQVKWDGLQFSTLFESPIAVGLRTYYQGTLVQSNFHVASIGTVGLGASGGWTQITGHYVVPAGVDTVRMSIYVAQSGTAGTVWFDDVSLRKTNSMQQRLVGNLVGTVNGIWEGLTGAAQGSGTLEEGTGDTMFGAASAVQSTASTAYGNANTAVSNVQTTIDGIHQTVGSGTGTGNPASTVQTGFAALLQGLFGQTKPAPTLTGGTIPSLDATKIGSGTFNTGRIPNLDATKINSGTFGSSLIPNLDAGKIISGVFGGGLIPGLDASKLVSGYVSVNRLPTSDIGAALLPTEGSGALITRRNTSTAINATVGRNQFPTGFFDNTDRTSADITISNGNRFTVSMAGWYQVSMGYRLTPGLQVGWAIATALYKNGSVFRIGTDTMGVAGLASGQQRYAAGNFIVYLEANDYVTAGYDAWSGINGIFTADGSGAETYFAISLLNKSYA